ncbi:DNA cytosine methyltransferase [Streptomyces sp. NPDC001953]
MPYINSTSRSWAAASAEANAPKRVRAYKHDGGDLSVSDWFAGCGGSGQGADAVPGLRVAFAANHWRQAIKSHQFNFPGIAHYIGDIRKAPVWAWPITDVFWASPECFPAGTLILTRRGHVPIEDVQVGDEVFTHQRRWRQVTRTMRKTAETVMVKGVGHAGGIETTAEHPFYTRQRAKVWQDKKHGYRWHLTGEPEWTEAKNLAGRMWATPLDFSEELPVPEVGGRGGVEFSPEFWWLVGRWLGDGSLRYDPDRSGKNRYDMLVTCGHHEADDLAKRLDAVLCGLTWYRREQRTVTVFAACHRGLVEWLVEHFGRHSYGKTIPAWALSMPVEWRRALLDGYLSADGSVSGPYAQAATVSKRLALGIRMLANSLGHVANLSGPRTRKGVRRIEGRVLNERPQWNVNWITDGPKHSFHVDQDGYRWAPVKSVEPTGRTVEVFNLSVADDESYMADGAMSHNCTQWSVAKGKKRSWAKAVQGDLLSLYADMEEAKFKTVDQEDNEPTAEEEASRALMEEVPLYLRGVIERGGLIKAGVVENVVDVRAWAEWDAWLAEFHKLGYRTRVIALNSMHANPRSVHRAPQSRDRLYVGYWHKSLGRTPDWDKWLRPKAYCAGCDEMVSALQVFRKPGQDMGRYKSSYDYRCPRKSCRALVDPDVLPAAAAIDWSIKGTPIGSRPKSKECPEGLAPNTMARIRAGIAKYWPQPGAQVGQETLFDDLPARQVDPFLVPTGGTWRNGPAGVDTPISTRTTVESDALVLPPILIPCEGREGKKPMSLDGPLRTQTARLETALAYVPFVVPMRGGGDKEKARYINHPVHTVSAGGNHHGLVMAPRPLIMRNNTPNGDPAQMVTGADEPFRAMTTTGHQSLITPDPLLVSYYGNGQARPTSEPVGALPTRDRYALLDADGEYDVSKVLFRMLQPKEIQRAMAFADDYKILGSKRDTIRQLGNAVTPNAAEVLLCALVECITGEEIDRYAPPTELDFATTA